MPDTTSAEAEPGRVGLTLVFARRNEQESQKSCRHDVAGQTKTNWPQTAHQGPDILASHPPVYSFSDLRGSDATVTKVVTFPSRPNLRTRGCQPSLGLPFAFVYSRM